MPLTKTPPSAPTSDPRWKLVEATMRRHGYKADALIETLHSVQSAFGYLDEPSLQFVAASLRVPLSRTYGVATFYHLFSLRPPGKHTCVVCMGTTCYIKGAQALTEGVERQLKIRAGETTPDGQVSLVAARCLGSCSLAPAVVLDGEMHGKIAPEKLSEKIAEWTQS